MHQALNRSIALVLAATMVVCFRSSALAQDVELERWRHLQQEKRAAVTVQIRTGSVMSGTLRAVDDGSLTLDAPDGPRTIRREDVCTVSKTRRRGVATMAWAAAVGTTCFLLAQWLRGLGENGEGAGAPWTGLAVGGAIGAGIGARIEQRQPRLLFRSSNPSGCRVGAFSDVV